MDYENTYHELGDYAHSLIHSKARSLVGTAGFTSADVDDIEQDLALDLIVRLKKYDPTRSRRNTFMTLVVERRIATMLEARRACRRDWRLCLESIDDPDWQTEEADGIPQIEKLPDPMSRGGSDLVTQLDIQRVVERLPEDLRDLWRRLLDSNMSQISRELGVPRTTLYYRLGRLRKALRDAGL